MRGFVEGEIDLGPFLDARSRTSLVNHTGTSWKNGLLLIMGTTKTLHKGPTLAGLDLLSGEPEIYEFDPLKQPVLKTPHFEVEYHGFYPGRFRNHSSRGSGDAGRLSSTKYYRFSPTPDEALLQFTLQPSGTGQQVEMELSDGQGYTEETSVWRYRLVRWERPASSLKTARVTYYPKVTRVMVHIPALPGLERNRDVENLLDVKIPLIRIEDHYHWHYAIGALAMMPAHGGSHSHTIPYPLEFRDITLRELIQIYLEYHPDQTVVYDPIEDKLIFMPRPGPQKIWRDTVDWFRHQF
jgi:hypothetical protein